MEDVEYVLEKTTEAFKESNDGYKSWDDESETIKPDGYAEISEWAETHSEEFDVYNDQLTDCIVKETGDKCRSKKCLIFAHDVFMNMDFYTGSNSLTDSLLNNFLDKDNRREIYTECSRCPFASAGMVQAFAMAGMNVTATESDGRFAGHYLLEISPEFAYDQYDENGEIVYNAKHPQGTGGYHNWNSLMKEMFYEMSIYRHYNPYEPSFATWNIVLENMDPREGIPCTSFARCNEPSYIRPLSKEGSETEWDSQKSKYTYERGTLQTYANYIPWIASARTYGYHSLDKVSCPGKVDCGSDSEVVERKCFETYGDKAMVGYIDPQYHYSPYGK